MNRIRKFNESLSDNIVWDIKDGSSGKTYFSDNRSEFVIFKENNTWILRYTDFWTSSPDSFFVNVKGMGEEMFAVPSLKKYAQKLFDIKKTLPSVDVEL